MSFGSRFRSSSRVARHCAPAATAVPHTETETQIPKCSCRAGSALRVVTALRTSFFEGCGDVVVNFRFCHAARSRVHSFRMRFPP